MAVRATQVSGQVLTQPTGAAVRATQVSGQVLAQPTSAKIRATAVSLQVLVRLPRAGGRHSLLPGCFLTAPVPAQIAAVRRIER